METNKSISNVLNDFIKSVLNPNNLDFMVVGSLALNNIGFEVSPHDIDIEVVCDKKQEKIFKILSESQNKYFHDVYSKKSDAESRMENVTWTHKPYIFKWKGVEINVWIVTEFSHKDYYYNKIFDKMIKFASPISVLKKKMAYKRNKDFLFMNDLVKKLLSI